MTNMCDVAFLKNNPDLANLFFSQIQNNELKKASRLIKKMKRNR